MKKTITLFLAVLFTTAIAQAQSFAFIKNNEILPDNAEVTINAVVDDLGGGYATVKADTNPDDKTADQYYMKAVNDETANVEVNATIVSTTSPSIKGQICLGNNCKPLPGSVTVTLTRNADKLMTHADFTNDTWTGGIDGTVKVKLEAQGSVTRVLYITFVYDSTGVETVVSKSDVRVENGMLVTNIATPGTYEVTVSNFNGQEVGGYTLSENDNVSLSELPKGFYIYSVKANGNVLLTDKFALK